MTAIILAGGKATRMSGRDKAFLKLGKEFLYLRQLRLLKRYFKYIIIVTNSPLKYKNIKSAKVITDIIPHQGPLGGILAGLSASKDKYNFVVAVDMPHINSGLIKYMFKKRNGFDIIAPKVNNRPEPLFCIYSKNCIAPIKRLLDEHIYKVRELFLKVKTREITETEILQFGPPAEIFLNINTPEDLSNLGLSRIFQ